MIINARTLWTSLLTLLVLSIAIVALAAQPPGGLEGRRPGLGPGYIAFLRGLELTEPQREQIRAILQEQRTAGSPIRKLAELRSELRVAIFADAPDHAKIDGLKQAIAEAEAAALEDRIDRELRIAQILTPEQRAKAREMPGPGGRGRGARP